MARLFKSSITLAVILVSSLALARQERPRFSFFKPSEPVKKDRWTIADWFDTKKKMNMMDMWLAHNRSTKNWEVVLSYDRGSYEHSTHGIEGHDSYNIWQGRAQVFSTIFGLDVSETQSTQHWKDTTGIFWLRVLGLGQQNFHWLIGGGYHQRTDTSVSPNIELKGSLVASSLTLYLIQTLGVQGEYKYYFKAEDSNLQKWLRTSWQAGPFLDVGMARIFGVYFEESLTPENSAKQLYKGLRGGLQIFF